MNIQRLKNGIGAASVVGIVALLVSVALEPDKPPSTPSPVLASGYVPQIPSDASPPSLASPSVGAPTSTSESPQSASSTSNTGRTRQPNTVGTAPTTTVPTRTSPSVAASTTTQPALLGATPPQSTVNGPVGSGPSAPPTTTTTTTPTRDVRGTAVTLGSGSFIGGTQVMSGLYDVTTEPGQIGTFIVTGADSYNETLDASGTRGVPKVRVQISTGDRIRITGLSEVVFTPVSTPFVTTQSAVDLYAGTWTVGQDLGPGRYVATPGTGQSGRFVIGAEGVNVVLGGGPSAGGVPNVTFSVKGGDVIDISGLGQVALTPS